jgi:hypothetical protein
MYRFSVDPVPFNKISQGFDSCMNVDCPILLDMPSSTDFLYKEFGDIFRYFSI